MNEPPDGGVIQPVESEVREHVAELVQTQAGDLPSPEVLVLSSSDGSLARALAEAATDWTVYTSSAVDLENVEQVALDLDRPRLPFDDETLGLVTATALETRFDPWGVALAKEVLRVLKPHGRVLILFRGPSPKRPRTPWMIGEDGRRALLEAGFDPADEVHISSLPDGSWVYRVSGWKSGPTWSP